MDALKYISPPVLLYQTVKKQIDLKKKNEKVPTLLLSSGMIDAAENFVTSLLIAFVVMIILYVYCFIKFAQRGKIMSAGGVPRGWGRSIITVVHILFNAPLYAIYSMLQLYIPNIGSIHPNAYKQVMGIK